MLSVDEVERALHASTSRHYASQDLHGCCAPRSGRSCVVRPNMELNDRKFSQKELVCAHRYVAQEGWTEYAIGLWKPDPELSRFMDDSLQTNG